jgi:maltose phosphorylase
LQCFYFFEDHFSKEEQNILNFYESFTVTVPFAMHSIRKQHCLTKWIWYTFIYELRLDLDDNKEVEEGCHITSMAGTWMSIVEGFGGMR